MGNVGYKYELQKGSKHILCPKCQKKTFKPYVKVGTNIVVDAMKWGRCERIQSCSYHRYPDTNEDWTPPPFVYTPPKPIDYVPKELMEQSFSQFKNNSFFRYLVKVFGKEKAFDLQSLYNIGTCSNNGTLFFQVDRDNKIRTAKAMFYDRTGHRRKDKNSYYIHYKVKEDYNLSQVLFGEHLIHQTEKEVFLVESEKTAVIMAGFYPERIYLAAGGANMLNSYRLNRLHRLDYVLPDQSPELFKKWEKQTSIFTNRQMDVSVEKAYKDGIIEAGADILDLELIQRGLDKIII